MTSSNSINYLIPTRQLNFMLPLLASLGFFPACRPQGEIVRQIHPLHQIGAGDNQFTGLELKNSRNIEVNATRPGLPVGCSLETPHAGPICISCIQTKYSLQRCYNFKGELNPQSSCVHSSAYLKCLHQDPLFAININFKPSLEILLGEQFHTWETSIKAITYNQFTKNQAAELEQALSWTFNFLQQLVSIQPKDPWDGSPLQEKLWTSKNDSQSRPKLQRLFDKLYLQKLEGTLKLRQVLAASREWLAITGFSSSILVYWDALNIEGLEEPTIE